MTDENVVSASTNSGKMPDAVGDVDPGFLADDFLVRDALSTLHFRIDDGAEKRHAVQPAAIEMGMDGGPSFPDDRGQYEPQRIR